MITQTSNLQISNHKHFRYINYQLNFYLIIVYCLVIGIWSLIFTRDVSAASLSVTMSVGLTYFQVEGYTSPGALVILKEGGSVVGSTTSSSDGSFSLTVSSFDGTYTYTLYATDLDGNNTQSLLTTVSLTPGNTTTLGGLILPPTFRHNGLDQLIGNDLVFTGMGVPGSNLLLIVDSTTTHTSRINQQGRYTLRLTTDNISAGSHALILKNQTDSGSASDPTLSLTLTLRDRSAASLAPTSSPSTSPSITPVPRSLPSWLRPFDINQDNLLSLTELGGSVDTWLKSWLQTLRSSRTGNCDLNGDGVCNLIDLSILLYYVGR